MPSGAVTYEEVHAVLLGTQLLRNPEKGLIEALRDNLDPYRRRTRRVDFEEGRCAQAPGLKANTDIINLEYFRLNSVSRVWNTIECW